MKKWLTYIITIAVLSVFPDIIAQEKADSIYNLDDVVVTVSKLEARNYSIPAIISVKTLSDIQVPGNKNYFEILSKDAGIKINSRQDNAVFNDIDIRGLSGNATSGTNLLIILDGIPQRRLSYGGPYPGALPSEAVTKMELMKGPASSLYGRFALAGVLQLITDPASDNFITRIKTSYDDLTGGVQTSLNATGTILPKLKASFLFNTLTSEGWRVNTDSKRKEAYLNLGYTFNESGSLKILAGHINTFEEIPSPLFINPDGILKEGFIRNSNIAVPGQNNMSLKENRIALIWNQKFLNQLSFDFKTSYWSAKTFNHVGRPDDQPATGTLVARSSSNRDWDEYVFFNEVEAKYRWLISNSMIISTVVGGSYEKLHWYQKQTNIGISGTNQNIPLDLTTMIEPDPHLWIYTIMPDKITNENDYGMFIKTQLHFTNFNIHLGLRYDGFTRTQFNPSNSGIVMKLNNSALSPNIGCIIQVYKTIENQISIYGDYGKGFSPVYRAVGSTAFAPVLPELSENYECGLKSSFWNSHFNIQGAYYDLSRLNVVVTNPADNVPVNGGEWNNKGIEVAMNIIPHSGYSFYTNIAKSFSEIVKDVNDPENVGNSIPLNAGIIISAGLEIRNINLYNSNQNTLELEGSIDYQFVAKRYGNEGNSFILPEYQLFNFNADIKWNKNILIGFFIKNIFDELYLSTAFSSVKIGSAFLGQPRSYGLSCQIEIAVKNDAGYKFIML